MDNRSENRFEPGDIVCHFKRETLSEEEKNSGLYTYEIVGVAVHTETREEMMVYRALYGDKRMGPDSQKALRDRPLIDKWTFSTNGVAIQGRYGIPCVGFGPGAESQAHAPNEITWKQDLVRVCAVLTAAIPLYTTEEKTDDVTVFRAGKTNNDIL